ncbi:hypothetical protein [Clostridium butyricum]
MVGKILSVDERVAKRENVIPKSIQEEVLKILNTNALLYGFYISIWSERRVIKLLKEKYGIKITAYMAEALLEDVQGHSNNEINEIDELNRLGYDMFSVHFIKIGAINKDELESLTNRKFFNEKLDINLAIAIGKERMYTKLIFSEVSINFKKVSLFDKEIRSLEANEKEVVDNKANFIKQVANNEKSTGNIVFVSEKDRYIERFNKTGANKLFYIVNKKNNEELLRYYKKNREIDFINSLQKYSYRKFESINKVEEAIDNALKKNKIKNISILF